MEDYVPDKSVTHLNEKMLLKEEQRRTRAILQIHTFLLLRLLPRPRSSSIPSDKDDSQACVLRACKETPQDSQVSSLTPCKSSGLLFFSLSDFGTGSQKLVTKVQVGKRMIPALQLV